VKNETGMIKEERKSDNKGSRHRKWCVFVRVYARIRDARCSLLVGKTYEVWSWLFVCIKCRGMLLYSEVLGCIYVEGSSV